MDSKQPEKEIGTNVISDDEQREIEKRTSEVARAAQSNQRSGCFVALIAFVLLSTVVGSMGGDGGEIVALLVFAAAIAIGVFAAKANKKETDAVVARTTEEVKSIQETRRSEMDDSIKNTERSGFIFSKTVKNTTNTACIALDTANEKLFVKDRSSSRILKYDQLVSYELCKDGKTYINGDPSGAIVGGLLFGTVGAIAGAAGSSKNVNTYCSDMYISVVDDSAHRFRIPLITETVLESSVDFKVASERAREMLALLGVVEDANKKRYESRKSLEKKTGAVGLIGTQMTAPAALERISTNYETHKPVSAAYDRVHVNADNYGAILDRIDLFLEDGDWDQAIAYCESALDFAPKSAEVYIRRLLADLRLISFEELENCAEPFDENDSFKKAMRFGDEKTKAMLSSAISHINMRNENYKLGSIYETAVRAMNDAQSESAFVAASAIFKTISGFKDASVLAERCVENAEAYRKNKIYGEAISLMQENRESSIKRAIESLVSISGWKDSDEQIKKGAKRLQEITARAEEERLKRERQVEAERLERERQAETECLEREQRVEADRLERDRKAEEKRLEWERNEREHLEQEKSIIETKKRRKRVVFTTVIIIAAFAIGFLLAKAIFTGDGTPSLGSLFKLGTQAKMDKEYSAALELVETKEYEAAIEAFSLLNGYRDSIEQIEICRRAIMERDYSIALDLFNAGNYDEALTVFRALNSYNDSDLLAIESECLARLHKEQLKAGASVRFGYYEQDNNPSNGKEEIEWIVLEVKDGKALLLSKYALDYQPYDKARTTYTWEKCTLREWLNDSFINEAFKQGLIDLITETSDEVRIEDKVFLLTRNEIKHYFKSEKERQCKGTEYAYGLGLSRTNCWGWLAEKQDSAIYRNSGEVIYSLNVNYYGAIRPALWITLNPKH